MMITRIVRRKALPSEQGPYLEHHFDVSGPKAALIQGWLIQDNKAHGEWRLSFRGIERFQIWANRYDSASIRQVDKHIARLKATWDAPEHLVHWESH